MYIIDKNTDFYDYYSHIYGVDKQIIFDRRGSIILDNLYCVYPSYCHIKESFCLLEIGYKQYIFCMKNFVFDKLRDIKSFTVDLIYEYNNNQHFFKKEISLIPLSYYFPYEWKLLARKKGKRTYEHILKPYIDIKDLHYNESDIIELPILKNTQFVKFLNPESVWMDINTFISSKKNDKNIDIINTDKDKVINHGFDVKSSFRNIK